MISSVVWNIRSPTSADDGYTDTATVTREGERWSLCYIVAKLVAELVAKIVHKRKSGNNFMPNAKME